MALYCIQYRAIVIYMLCDAGSKIRSFGRDTESKLKIMSLEVDSHYHIEYSMKAIRNGYGLWLASHLVRSLIDVISDMRTVVGILAFGRHTTCIALNFFGRHHPVISHEISLVVFLSLCCVPSYPVRHMRCFSIDIMAFTRYTIFGLLFLAFCCVSSCLVRSRCCSPSGDNSILYADGRRHFGFLATCYLYGLELYGEAPSGDIGFDTYMCGRSSRNILRYSGIGPRISLSSSQFCQRHWVQKALLYMHPGGLIESGSKARSLYSYDQLSFLRSFDLRIIYLCRK